MSALLATAPLEQLRRIRRDEYDKMVELGLFADERVAASSQPEPDIAVVPRGDYRRAHPNEALLIVEVADSSLATDRGTKARLCAECGVPEYWVVNVRDGIVEVHTEIVERVYTRVEPYRAGGTIRLLRFPDVEIAASDVL